ncbi:MAG: AAA family ATPase [Sporolactobacillus sp.]
MKPIELTVRGLNSFREEQRIDFEALCADGIFGIFGPTGSGKSTILDAMTLALYGTVERAANNTQGILNQLEDQLAVGFTFELNGAQTKRYRVERSYKRIKDDGLRMASCRLLQLGVEKQVLADKERDVTRKIQEILGLTHDDFTRAVVLPQGKFAEFLSLKGNERRKMLQRLFHLEKYGEVLSTRLKAHADAARRNLATITEKESMLGDASKDALEALRVHSQETKKELDAKRISWEKESQVYDELLKVEELQKEKAAKQKDLQLLENQREAIQGKKQALILDQAADALIPYLDAFDSSGTELKEAEKVCTENKKQLHDAEAAEQLKKKALEQAKQSLAEQEPEITGQKQQMQEGISVQRRLKELQINAQTDKQSLEQLTQQMNRESEEEKRISQLIEDHDERLRDAEKRMEILFLSARERSLLQAAREEKGKLDSLSEQIDRKRQDWTRYQQKWLADQEAMNRLQEKQKQKNDQGQQLFARYQHIYCGLAALAEQIGTARKELEYQREEAQQKHERDLRQSLAYQLASALEDGEPCPVCGAIHHPLPAAEQKLPDETHWENKLSDYQRAEQRLSQAQQDCRLCLLQMEQRAKNIADLLDGLPDLSTEKEALIRKKAEQRTLLQIAADFRNAVKAGKQDMLQTDAGLEQLTSDLQQLKLDRSEVEAHLKFYQDKKIEIEQEARKDKSEVTKRLKDWSADYQAPEKIDTAFQKMQEDDQEREQIQQSIQKIRKERETQEEKRSDYRNKRAEIESDFNRLQGRMESFSKNSIRCQQELEKLGFSAASELDVLLKQAGNRLTGLQAAQERADKDWRESWTIRIHLEKALESAGQRLQRAEKDWANVSELWQRKLADSDFRQRSDVLEAHLDDQSRIDLKNQVDSYEQKTAALSTELRSVSEKLGGRSVTADAIEASHQQLTALQATVQNLSEAFGAAINQLKDLEQRHLTFKMLESERKKVQKAADQFEQLQRVFRGNAFVEFVASEQLQQVCVAASARLSDLTHGRYALESDTSGGFSIRDNGNGGVSRPVSSLSGGETFLTSLALALSLSEQIQLNGHVPLQFFFLDEGFGTLDPELLDTVLTALEKLHLHRLSIGVISHVPEMRERLPRKLIVEAAEPSGRGSRLHLEVL